MYAIEIYANNYLTRLHDLEILNNRLLRIVQNKTWNASTKQLYIDFNTLPINKLFRLQIASHAHALVNHSVNLPQIFHNDFISNRQVHTHSTRSATDFHRMATNSSAGDRLSMNICAKFWNSLPSYLKSNLSPFQFKKLLKIYLRDEPS